MIRLQKRSDTSQEKILDILLPLTSTGAQACPSCHIHGAVEGVSSKGILPVHFGFHEIQLIHPSYLEYHKTITKKNQKISLVFSLASSQSPSARCQHSVDSTFSSVGSVMLDPTAAPAGAGIQCRAGPGQTLPSGLGWGEQNVTQSYLILQKEDLSPQVF